ncbi:MAG: hypothetical protein DRP87_20015, partial [Spirochaetes bacterium]
LTFINFPHSYFGNRWERGAISLVSSTIVPLYPLPVLAGSNTLNPLSVVKIPAYRLLKALLKSIPLSQEG